MCSSGIKRRRLWRRPYPESFATARLMRVRPARRSRRWGTASSVHGACEALPCASARTDACSCCDGLVSLNESTSTVNHCPHGCGGRR
ncbi:MAG: hypothetical protein ACI9OJ_000290 [Myxococcota bacterium]|jgi:hypothetical protein